MHAILEFLANNNSRVTCGDKWLVVEKVETGDYKYTVFQRSYGRRKSTVVYEGYHQLSALGALEPERQPA